MEGMADYISYKIINDNPFFNEHLHYYADSIENQLWDAQQLSPNDAE
jgi:hypothetical protein